MSAKSYRIELAVDPKPGSQFDDQAVADEVVVLVKIV